MTDRSDGRTASADAHEGRKTHNREWLERLMHAADEAAHALRILDVPHEPGLLADIESLGARLRVQLAQLD